MNEHALFTKCSFKREKLWKKIMENLRSTWRDFIKSKFVQLGKNLSISLFAQINVLQTQIACKVQNLTVNNQHSTHELMHALLQRSSLFAIFRNEITF